MLYLLVCGPVRLIASVIILKLAAIQVAGWSELADLFFTHLLASCLQRSTIQLANLFKSLFVSLLLKIFGFVWIRKSAKTNDFSRVSRIGGTTGARCTCMTKKIGTPIPAPTPSSAATNVVTVSESNSTATWASSMTLG